MKEVPVQYKTIVEIQTINIMKEAEKLWPFIQELGHYYECETEDIIIVIKKNIGEDHTDAFEKWLKSSCLQSPTKEAYDLAKDAWMEASKKI